MRVLPSLVCLATSALAFVPPVPTPTTHDKPPTAAEVAVKGVQKLLLVPALLGGFAGVSGSFIAPTPAYADGAVSPATVARASGVYGPRILALKDAVTNGDFDAIKAEDTAFRLYNSGAFALNRPLQKQVQAAYKELQSAVTKKDAGALKSAFDTYSKVAGLDKTNPFALTEPGRIWGSDFAYTYKNKLWGTDASN